MRWKTSALAAAAAILLAAGAAQADPIAYNFSGTLNSIPYYAVAYLDIAGGVATATDPGFTSTISGGGLGVQTLTLVTPSTSNCCGGNGYRSDDGTDWTDSPLMDALPINKTGLIFAYGGPVGASGQFDVYLNGAAYNAGFFSSASTPGGAHWTYNDAVSVTVPEPASWTIMLAGLGAFGFMMRKRRKKAVASA